MSKAVAPIAGAIFDCDGTLLDSLGRWRGVEQMLARHAHVQVQPEERALFVSFTVPEVARYFHEHYGLGANPQAVRELINDYMMEYYAGQAACLPGVGDLLEACASSGVRMAVASSSAPMYLEAGLATAGIRSYFDVVLSVDDVGAPKREPVIFNRACADLGTPREQTWGFDDSVYAMETLRSAGFPVVGLCDGEDGASLETVARAATVAVSNLNEVTVADGMLLLR